MPTVRKEELKALQLEESKLDEQRQIGDRSQSVRAGMCLEREHTCYPWPQRDFKWLGVLPHGERDRVCEGGDELLNGSRLASRCRRRSMQPM